MLGEVIPHKGCLSLYHLESDGSDSSGYNHNLYNLGYLAEFAAGKFGDGLAYNEEKRLLYGYDIGMTSIFGLSFWFRIDLQPGVGNDYEFVYWSANSRGNNVTYRSVYGTGYKIQLKVGERDVIISADFEATNGRWYKCDITSDGAKAYLYIDGTKYIKMDHGTIGSYEPAIAIFGVNQEAVRGMIDEVAFFDYHRTEQDIARQYAFEMGMLG